MRWTRPVAALAALTAPFALGQGAARATPVSDADEASITFFAIGRGEVTCTVRGSSTFDDDTHGATAATFLNDGEEPADPGCEGGLRVEVAYVATDGLHRRTAANSGGTYVRNDSVDVGGDYVATHVAVFSLCRDPNGDFCTVSFTTRPK